MKSRLPFYMGLFGISLFLSLCACESEIREELRLENTEIERIHLRKIFPNQIDYRFAFNGMNSKYILNPCPIIDNGPSYITIEMQLSDEIDPESIAYYAIYIYKMEKPKKKDSVLKHELVYDKYYLPNGSSNTLKLSNFFPSGNYKIDIGFFMKSDASLDYPKYHRKSCTFKIN